MPTPTRSGLLAFLLRAAPPAARDADAALLNRFVAHREEAAFANLVHRHGPMVFHVCRRRLGTGPDAEDAFQATFLALARNAATIARRESLAGWLHRVAYRISMKAFARTARRCAATLPDADFVAGRELSPDSTAQLHELQTALDAELAALPDRLRAVAVLCLLEGQTNTEAAERLGVPKGTIDSRLNAARKRLQSRLMRRGAAGLGVLTLDQLTETPVLAGFDALATRAIRLVNDGATGPEFETISSLATGVSTMTTTTRKLVVAALLSAGLVSGLGFGVYYAAAGPADPQQDPAAKPADPSKPAAASLVANFAPPPGKTAETTAILNEAAKFDQPLDDITIAELFQQMSKTHDVTFRLDIGLFRRIGIQNPYETKIAIPVVKGLSVRDVLQEVIDVLSPAVAEGGGGMTRLGVHVKGTQVIITRAFVPPTAPGAYKTGAQNLQMFVAAEEIPNLLYGPTLAIAVAEKPLADVVAMLREQTGANIVVDARVKEKAAAPITLTLNDTRLFTVLKIAGDMCDVAPAVVDNVFYLTSKENAERMMKETERNLFGEPQVSIPAGYVTDGIRLYEKPTNLKPVDPAPLGAGQGGLGGIGLPTTIPESIAKPATSPKK